MIDLAGEATLARVVPRAFFDRPPSEVGPELLGKLLRRHDGRMARLVEVEAYAQDDPAAHTFRGLTERNRSMFGPPGHWYVYLSYGIHWCANVVCAGEGIGAGLLLRAAEPLAGIERMREARGRTSLRELCSGPGRLAQAFGIDRGLDGTSVMAGGTVAILDDGTAPAVLACPRIGISRNAAAPLRFVVPGSVYLSRPAPRAT